MSLGVYMFWPREYLVRTVPLSGNNGNQRAARKAHADVSSGPDSHEARTPLV